MIKTINTQAITDANLFGEIFREYAFKDEGGCYSCFDLIDEFKPVTPGYDIEGRLQMALGIHVIQDREDYPHDLRDRAQLYTNETIHIGWYWDGDGCLAVIEGDRVAVNPDCKKDYTWEWVV